MTALQEMQISPGQAAGAARNGGIDAARLALALLVVMAHCASFMAVSPAAHFYFNNGFARVIVPFFLLTTGYFFDRQIARGIGPWVWRVMRVYLGWTLVFLPFLLFYQEVTPYRLGLTLFFGFFHLWYLPALIGGMVLLHAARNLPDGVLMGLAAGLFCIGGTVQYAENLFLDLSQWPNPYDLLVLTRNFLFYGFPFLALGLLIARGRLLAGISPMRRLGLLLLATAMLVVETTLEYRSLDPEGFYDLTFSAFVLTPVLFVTVRDLPVVLPGFDPRRMSMVIYLSHPLYLLPLRELTGWGPVTLTLATFALTLTLAPAWMWLGQRLKILP
jgi:surface polysaccharide O-acyltransferase-like enzyme